MMGMLMGVVVDLEEDRGKLLLHTGVDGVCDRGVGGGHVSKECSLSEEGSNTEHYVSSDSEVGFYTKLNSLGWDTK